jgi:hypothetical protein
VRRARPDRRLGTEPARLGCSGRSGQSFSLEGTPPADDLRGGATPVATDPRRTCDERHPRGMGSRATRSSRPACEPLEVHRRSAHGHARTGAGRPRRGARRHRDASGVRQPGGLAGAGWVSPRLTRPPARLGSEVGRRVPSIEPTSVALTEGALGVAVPAKASTGIRNFRSGREGDPEALRRIRMRACLASPTGS